MKYSYGTVYLKKLNCRSLVQLKKYVGDKKYYHFILKTLKSREKCVVTERNVSEGELQAAFMIWVSVKFNVGSFSYEKNEIDFK